VTERFQGDSERKQRNSYDFKRLMRVKCLLWSV